MAFREFPAAPSLSTTTREKRPNEVNGVDYNFVSQEEFTRKVLNGMGGGTRKLLRHGKNIH